MILGRIRVLVFLNIETRWNCIPQLKVRYLSQLDKANQRLHVSHQVYLLSETYRYCFTQRTYPLEVAPCN